MNNELRIKILLCISIVFVGTAAFAKTKIALIGDSEKANQIADMVLTKMADNDDLEFLERSAIKKVMKEHKLLKSGLDSKKIPVIAKILHTDIFAVLSSAQINKKTVPSSLRVFDARNGFCLLNTALPTEIEKCIAFIGNKLENLPNPKSFKFVSILTVRNAGAPAKYKRQMAHIAMEVERRLIAMPDVVVLERSELGLVNKERTISKKNFKLASSAYLLDLEFSPTSSVNKIDLRIYVLNTSGKELKNFVFPDCLKTPPQKIIKTIAKYLNISSSTQVADAKLEAKRFFEEYKYSARNNRYDDAESKLNSAIALAPNNPDYRLELANYIQEIAKHWPACTRDEQRFFFLLASAKRAMKICNEIEEQFPYYNKPLYTGWSSLTLTFFGSISKNLSHRQIEEAEMLLKDFRLKHFNELAKYSYHFDLSNGINSSKELRQYNLYMAHTCRDTYYLNFENYVVHLYNAALEELKKTKKALLEKSKLTKTKIDPPCFFRYFSGHYDQNYYHELENQVTDSRELVELAKAHPSKDIQSCGHLLELFRKTIHNNYDPKKFKHDFKTYVSGDYPNYQKFLEGSFERFHKELYKIMQHEKIAIQTKQGESLSEEMLVYRLLYAKTTFELANLIIENNKLILKLREKCIKDEFRDYFFSFAKKLSNGLEGNNVKICQKALTILNYPLIVNRLRKVSDFGISARMSGYAWIVNAKKINEKLYLLMTGYKSIAIFCFDPVENKLTKIWKLDEIPNIYDSLYKDVLPFHVGKNNFLVGIKNQIIVISRNGVSHSFIKGIPGELIRTMVVLNGRIFAFAGKYSHPGFSVSNQTTLFSCLLNGSSRKIHISTSRREKKNIFDKQSPFIVSDLFTNEKHQKILFACTGAIGGLWEFDPLKGKYIRHIKLDNSCHIWAMKNKKKLYVSNSSDYYIFDLNTKQANFVFYSGPSIKHLKTKPQFYRKLFLRPPFFIQNEQMWVNRNGTKFFPLNKQINMQYIYGLQYGRAIPVIPHPDGRSVLIASKDSIYKITPPEIKE
jgi:hypothetical protein